VPPALLCGQLIQHEFRSPSLTIALFPSRLMYPVDIRFQAPCPSIDLALNTRPAVSSILCLGCDRNLFSILHFWQTSPPSSTLPSNTARPASYMPRLITAIRITQCCQSPQMTTPPSQGQAAIIITTDHRLVINHFAS